MNYKTDFATNMPLGSALKILFYLCPVLPKKRLKLTIISVKCFLFGLILK